ncbi:MAG: L-2-amino-thiazoline-4-carboxylic acid hydrolase [Anaerolineae bacterium]
MTQKQPRWPWFGLGLITGLAGGWWLSGRRSATPRMLFLNIWQRELAKTRGATDAALLAGRIQAHYNDLWARRPHFRHPVLNLHVRASILPGLALYQVLREEHETQAAALAEAEKLIAVILTKQALPFPLLKRLPDPFAVFRFAGRWVLRLAFPAPGWNTTFVEDTADCLAFEVHDQCIYQKILTDFGAPELTAVFCQMDDLVYSQLAPEISFTHDKTLGRGDDYCSFRFCRNDVASAEDTAKTIV